MGTPKPAIFPSGCGGRAWRPARCPQARRRTARRRGALHAHPVQRREGYTRAPAPGRVMSGPAAGRPSRSGGRATARRNSAIPSPVIAAVSRAIHGRYTHSELNNLFMLAGAPGDPPAGNKLDKCRSWLTLCSRRPEVDGLAVLGELIEEFMEAERPGDDALAGDREAVIAALARGGLSYHAGGVIAAAGSAGPSRSLEDIIRDRDLPAVDEEFRRAMRSIESAPRDAVSAASNILESVCKIYIEDHEHLEMPRKKDLPSVWGVVRRELGFDPGAVATHVATPAACSRSSRPRLRRKLRKAWCRVDFTVPKAQPRTSAISLRLNPS